ncbi:MAG: HEAT repeat domain-containing protein [Planctomycetota bacterium]
MLAAFALLVGMGLGLPEEKPIEYFIEKVAEFEEFKRKVPRGRKFKIRGELKNRFKNPQLVLIAPNGKTYLNDKNTINGVNFVFEVQFKEGKGTYRCELMAESKNRVMSAARFHLHYGIRTPKKIRSWPPLQEGPMIGPDVHPRVLERRLLKMVNDFRKSIKEKRVGWNEAVASRAREHAEIMAEARTIKKKFGGRGVADILRQDGPLGDGWSGRLEPWGRCDSGRPFGPHNPTMPGPLTHNHVVVKVHRDHGLERMFEQYYVREPAFRLLLADPHLVEIAVGARRGGKDSKGRTKWYLAICFVQVNDKTIIKDLEETFHRLTKAVENRDVSLIRQLGLWTRPQSRKLLKELSEDEDIEVSGAAIDALLCIDEEATRTKLDALKKTSDSALERGRYAEALAPWPAYAKVRFDHGLKDYVSGLRRLSRKKALGELEEFAGIEDIDKRRIALSGLKRRCGDLPVRSAVERALKKLR